MHEQPAIDILAEQVELSGLVGRDGERYPRESALEPQAFAGSPLCRSRGVAREGARKAAARPCRRWR